MQKIDQNFASKTSVQEGLKQITLQNATEVKVYGLGWDACLTNLHRIPAHYEVTLEKVNPKLLHLSRHMSGIQIHFKTTSKYLKITADIKDYAGLTQMSAASQAGIDCYVGTSMDDLQFYDSFRPNLETKTIDQTVSLQTTKEKLVVLYLPLYAALEHTQLFIEQNSRIQPHFSFLGKKRIAIYGTSITQGGCASRSGLNFTNILSRKMQCEFINLGFSGNAFGEAEIQEIVASLQKVDLFVLDYEANSGTNGKLEETLAAFIRLLRKEHPLTKIAVVSRIKYLFDEVHFDLGKRRNQLKEFQKNLVAQLQQTGDKDVYFVDGSTFYDANYAEYTVDSIHPNDLGFERIANKLEQEFQNILLD